MRGEILGYERRPSLDDEEKLGKLCMAVGVDEATVTQVRSATRITRANRSMRWRHDLKSKGLCRLTLSGTLSFLLIFPTHGISRHAGPHHHGGPDGSRTAPRNGRSLHFDSSMAAVGADAADPRGGSGD